MKKMWKWHQLAWYEWNCWFEHRECIQNYRCDFERT